ncbi:MAG: carbohydrate ABC transporter permease [Spirochaetia bacterium]|jgi:putative aldouronate transport system permease protein
MPSFRNSPDKLLLTLIAYIVLGCIALITVFPFFVLVVNSFASEHAIINYGYSIVPRELSVSAYELVFLNPQKILQAYGVTIFITCFGTAASLFLSSMAAYSISRKDLRYRNKLAFFIYFTTLFNGGLAPTYIVITTILHLKNTLAVLILGPMFSVFYILILRNFFMNSIPASLSEAAKIDGAGDFTIFLRIVLPLTAPALASIGLFTALAYWNDWWTAMLYVERQSLMPLQYVLYKILSSVTMAANIVNNVATLNLPKESLKLAMTVISIGPIVLAYPFVQRFFIKGITLGSVKG